MIIVLAGPAGAGKDTAGEYIAKRLGIPHISGGDVLRRMLSDLGLEPKKSALGDFGTFLRKHYGPEVIFHKILEQSGGEMINSGLRSPSEISSIHRAGGVVVFIDCPQGLRHQRIIERARKGDEFDVERLKQFDIQEAQSTDVRGENLNLVRKQADMIIINDGTIEELFEKVDKYLVTLTTIEQ